MRDGPFARARLVARVPKPFRSRRARTGALAITAAGMALAGLAWSPAPRLVWNASASSPIGLYSLAPGASPRAGEMAVAWAPAGARALAAVRGYLPRNVPLVKHVAAAAGDRVCAAGALVSVNGRAVASRRRTDPAGRVLPRWTGCTRLRRGEVLLLSSGMPTAFDGRYFGVTRAGELIGRARLLWAR